MEHWLKKIFSLQFLGFVVAVLTLYYGYKQFVRDEPGQLCLATGNNTFDKKIRWVFIGFDMETDRIDLEHMRNIPLLGNMGEKPIEDVFMCGSIMEKISFVGNTAYTFRKGEETGHPNPYTFAVRMEKIPYFSFFHFPLKEIHGNARNGIHVSVNMAYTYKGHPNLENYFFILTGIPKAYKANSQISYAKYLIPYLAKLNKQDSVAIIFKDTMVCNLKDLQTIKEESFIRNLRQIKDFEK